MKQVIVLRQTIAIFAASLLIVACAGHVPGLSSVNVTTNKGVSTSSAVATAPKPSEIPHGFAPKLAKVWTISLGAVNAKPTLLKWLASTGQTKHGEQLLVPSEQDVLAYAAATGVLNWRTTVGLVQAPIGFSQDATSLLALVQGTEAVSLDAKTGQVLWRSKLPAEMRSQPVSVAGVFVVLTADGRLIGLDEKTGRRLWAVAHAAAPLTLRGAGTIAALPNGIALVGLPGGKVLGVNVISGQTAWESQWSVSRGDNDVERLVDIIPDWVSVPLVGLCASSYKQQAACIDGAGRVTRAQAMPVISSLLVDENQWLALEDDGTLKSWRLPATLESSLQLSSQSISQPSSPTGSPNTKPNWIFKETQGRMGNTFSPLAQAMQYVFVHDAKGFLHTIAAQTGQLIGQTATGLVGDTHLMAWVLNKQAVLAATSTLSTGVLPVDRMDGKTLLIAASKNAVSAWQIEE